MTFSAKGFIKWKKRYHNVALLLKKPSKSFEGFSKASFQSKTSEQKFEKMGRCTYDKIQDSISMFTTFYQMLTQKTFSCAGGG